MPMSSTAAERKRYVVSMLDMSTYRQAFVAESSEQALAMADADQEQHGLENWSEVASSTDFEIIDEGDADGLRGT